MISMRSMISMILSVFSWFPFVGAYLWSFSGHFIIQNHLGKFLCFFLKLLLNGSVTNISCPLSEVRDIWQQKQVWGSRIRIQFRPIHSAPLSDMWLSDTFCWHSSCPPDVTIMLIWSDSPSKPMGQISYIPIRKSTMDSSGQWTFLYYCLFVGSGLLAP